MRDVPSNITELSSAWGMNFYQAGGSSTKVLSDSEKSHTLITSHGWYFTNSVPSKHLFSEMIIVFNLEIAVNISDQI